MAILNGTAGADSLQGGWGDTVNGEAGADTLVGGGNTILNGGDGADLLLSSGGDRLTGGAGDDRYVVRGASEDVSIVASGRDVVEIESRGSVNIQGGSGVEVYVERAGFFMMTGGLSFTSLAYGGGYARWSLGVGQDVVELSAEAGAPAAVRLGLVLSNFEPGNSGDVLNLVDYLDALTNWTPGLNPFATGYLRLAVGGFQNLGSTLFVDFDGGGDNWTSLAEIIEVAPGALTARNFAGYDPGGAPLQGFSIQGTDQNLAWQTGAVDNDVIYGGVGADTLMGLSGGDVLRGAAGQDLIRGGDGADSILGGEAFDDLHGNWGEDTVRGGLGGDWVVGGQGNDMLYGEDDHDVVYGNLGNDTQEGGVGNDWVRGGQGSDSISGGAGDDYMAGDRGADTISGGAGADLFHTFSGAGLDRVLDFNAGEGDRVNVLAGSSYTLRQEGADTIVDMGGGDQMVLVGVTLSTLPAVWIFTS
jgi:Ca2+-binding RTX toxin-like protein